MLSGRGLHQSGNNFFLRAAKIHDMASGNSVPSENIRKNQPFIDNHNPSC